MQNDRILGSDPSSNGLQLQPFLGGQSLLFAELCQRVYGDQLSHEIGPDRGRGPASALQDCMLAPGATPAPARRSRSCPALASWGSSPIFDTDSRMYLTRFARIITLQARKIRPSSAGHLTDLRISVFAPFPLVPGADVSWKTGVLRPLEIFLTPRMFDFKGADPKLQNFVVSVDDYRI